MRKLTKKQRLYLYQFCADMIDSGIPLYDSIQKLRDEGKGLLGKGFIGKLDLISNRMAESESVNAVFAGLVPKDELSVIFSSEKSGSLSSGFRGIAEMINYRKELTSSIAKAVSFPLIMLVLALVVISGYAVKVFPAFERVIPTQRWPTVTQVLYSFGSSLYNGLWIYFLIFFIAAYIIIVLLLNNLTGNLRNNVLDRIIPFSIYKKMVCSVFISNLSSMLKNKVPINDSLTVLSQNANRWLYAHINIMLDNMARGDTYKDALNTGLLGKEEILNVSIYSGLPSFSDVLAAVALKARKDLAQAISRLSGLLKSLSTLVLGGCVVWVFVALFALSDTLSKMTSF
ncbi:type II secretion protein F [Salmonella enterica subsp. enterica serovar Nigeria]|uniref:type II secretion system F family protein n=1 Tax=Salmonella enterica TaxID=28901 RepID=UPI000FC29701|nr:type II secretion system F family protein [Salmonella enterica]EBA0745614.1 type II secretion protein F [Salmonella enterica subsp. enterica]EBC9935877.1 type II secretion protein F [Salmonella enterica subsp. enterica serovar Nigeria]EBU7767243.1 type II secretion protein F [Salmonella enterica subsp. enterica serovar Rovaniemi]ECF3578448.1 type II secretion protein F [Salmonella enterica subsp. enterica serovar Agama]EHG6571655.1 type II secretion protein F [Salmonella enterica subsp. ent